MLKNYTYQKKKKKEMNNYNYKNNFFNTYIKK